MATRTQGVQPRTVHVSDALQNRLDTYCAQREGHTPTTAVFEALEHLHGELPELMRSARAYLASPDPQPDVHYLGSGRVQIRLRPDEAQEAVLEETSAELGAPLATWLPPLLNAHLPGRREPENMPWLVQH